MTINEALNLMSGPVRQEYSDAIAARWDSIKRERDATAAVETQLKPAASRLRDYVRQRLGLSQSGSVSIEWMGRSFYIDHSKGPELVGPYLHFELRNGTRVSVHVEMVITSKEHLEEVIESVIPHVEAMRGPE